MTTREQELLDEYGYKESDVNAYGYISTPGKFEIEPIYVLHYYDLAGEGGEDEAFFDGDTMISAWIITKEDATDFPSLADSVGRMLLLWESDQGFVHHSILTPEEYERDVADALKRQEAECDTTES